MQDRTFWDTIVATLRQLIGWRLRELGRTDPDQPFEGELAAVFVWLRVAMAARPDQDDDDERAPHDHTVHRAAIVVRVRWMLASAVLACACAPEIPSPRERAASSDLAADAALEHQLVAIPGVASAHAAIHSAFRDPLSGAESPAGASLLVVISPGADRASIEAAAHQLAPTATLAIVPGPAPASSDHKLLAIAGLVVVLGAAGVVAWRTRPTA